MDDDPMNVDQNGHAEGDYNQNGHAEGDDNQNAQEEEGDDNQNAQEEEGDDNQNAQEEEGDDDQNAPEEEGDDNQNAQEEEGDDNQNAPEEEGGDNQNAQGEGGMNRPLVQLPRFGAMRVDSGDFFNRVMARRVPINGVPVPVLRKYLRWYEAVAGYDILKVYEGEGANDLLSTLTEEEWQRASPAPAETYRDFVMVYATTSPENFEYELMLRHGVHENEPPYYDLTHGWSRVVFDYGLREGDYVMGYGYRDVEGERLRLELRFYSGEEGDDLSGPQSEDEDEGEGEGEGGGNVIKSSSANCGSAAVAVSRERNQAPPPAARTARVRLPRFLNPEQPAKTHRVTTDPDGGGGAVLVLEKDLGLTDADADHNLLSVSEADGAGTPLRALTDGEWRKALPTNVEDLVKVLATGPNDDEYELRPRHRVLENEPPEYDLTHGWSRAVSDFGLKAGNNDIKDNPNVQEENQEDGEGEGEGGVSAAAAA